MRVDSLPSGYRFRAATVADAPAAASVITAAELDDGGESETTAEEVLSDWSRIDLAEDAVVVEAPDGAIVALLDIVNRAYVSISAYGYVHPDHRGKGIGRAIVERGERWALDRIEHAPADARVVVQHYLRSTNDGGRRLLGRCDYSPVRSIFTMETTLEAPPLAPEWPEGITVRSFRSGQDERATWETVEDTFRDLWGRPRNTFERFLRITGAEGFDPDLWFLAMDGDEIAGLSLCKIVGEQLIVETVGVRRHWRGCGLGLALLQHSFGVAWERNIPDIWLSVDADSLTGAPRLYQRAGMHVTASYILHQKELRPGTDYSQHALGE